MNESPKTRVGFRIRNLPWEPSENHAHEDDRHAPNISLSGIIRLTGEDLRGEVRIAADNTSSGGVGFAWVMEDGGGAKIDEFDDVIRCHDTVVKFEIPMSETHFVEIFHAITYLAKDAIDLRAAHFA
jgi:hypothetical protein